MREIKFRAWDKHEECYHTWEQLLNMRYNERWFIDNTDKQYINCLFTDNSYCLEQYTGLKDKNGKEIYEGDILEQKYILFQGQPPIHTREVVEFKDGEFACRKVWPKEGTIRTNVVYYSEKYPKQHFTAIGNIHENPELLK